LKSEITAVHMECVGLSNQDVGEVFRDWISQSIPKDSEALAKAVSIVPSGFAINGDVIKTWFP